MANKEKLLQNNKVKIKMSQDPQGNFQTDFEIFRLIMY